MPQVQTMTFDERFKIVNKSIELDKAGKSEESVVYILQHYPMPTYMAEFVKTHYPAEFFNMYKLNLSEVEAEFGSDWSTR